MSIKIPDRVTTAWISSLTNDELREVERLLTLDIQEKERLADELLIRDKQNGAVRFTDFGMHIKLCGRADTLRRRRDRACEEFVRRGLRDPRNLIPDGLRANLPPLPTRSWLVQLSDEELLRLNQQSRIELKMLRQEIARFYRTRPAPPDRDAQVQKAQMEQFRQEIFVWFAWAEIMQRDGLIHKFGSDDPPPPWGIGAIVSLSDYAAGHAEAKLVDWLERFAWYRNQEPLLYELRSILVKHSQQKQVDEQTDIKSLFRKIARLVHPDFAVTDEDRARRNEIMTKANEAYEESNEIQLRKILKLLESNRP